jgi:hypothetical protein
VRCGGGQPGQEEPVDGRDQQSAGEELEIHSTDRDQGGRKDGQRPTNEVGQVDDVPPAPAIEEHADVRPEDRIRDKEHGEARRDLDRVRLLGRIEQHRTGQGGLEQTVTVLAYQPYGE